MSDFIRPKMIRIANSLSIDMVRIKKGNFMMGSEDGGENEKPVHKVTIDHDFELGKYPVTIAEYRHFSKENKEHDPAWMDESKEYYKKMDLSDNAPAIGVSWDDAKAYCEWLSKKTGDAYRLPTEAEWEYAARAGTTTKWSFGDEESKLGEYAWYDKNSYDLGNENPDYGTHIVGKKKPNPWGLYDMHGNVWEWCEDDFVDNYEKTPRDGKAHKDETADRKVLRGGSWVSIAVGSRSADRDWDGPDYRSGGIGFRLLRTLPS